MLKASCRLLTVNADLLVAASELRLAPVQKKLQIRGRHKDVARCPIGCRKAAACLKPESRRAVDVADGIESIEGVLIGGGKPDVGPESRFDRSVEGRDCFR